MEREIKTHCGNLLNNSLALFAGEPGPGGASVQYEIINDTDTCLETGADLTLVFQSGNPAESINGISNEVLLAIVRDRLEGFQQGPFACEENRAALTLVVRAMDTLAWRSIDRKDRGVEGTQQP